LDIAKNVQDSIIRKIRSLKKVQDESESRVREEISEDHADRLVGDSEAAEYERKRRLAKEWRYTAPPESSKRRTLSEQLKDYKFEQANVYGNVYGLVAKANAAKAQAIGHLKDIASAIPVDS
jgi:hypothetical protein